jgi:hypothetical protein
MYELSLVELASELAAELPTRNLMCHRRVVRRKKAPVREGGNGGTSANASFGSGANANSTDQVNSNAQTVVNTGHVKGEGISLESDNQNENSNTQNATPLNFGIGN